MSATHNPPADGFRDHSNGDEEHTLSDYTPPATAQIVPNGSSNPSKVPDVIAIANDTIPITPTTTPRKQDEKGRDKESTTSPPSSAGSTGRKGRPPPTERHILTPLQEKQVKPKLNILPDNTILGFTNYLKTKGCRKIIVMTGAGISTSAGIPDFRTPGTGLYDNLAKYQLPYPEAIFDISYFRRKPQPFYELARELFPGGYKPTACHRFIKMLQDNHLLLRNYTQNIDMLERIAGVEGEFLVEAHGSFHQARCVGGIRSDIPSVFGSDSSDTTTCSDSVSDSEGRTADVNTSVDVAQELPAPQHVADGSSSPATSPVYDEGIEACGRLFTIDEFQKSLFDNTIAKCTCGGLIKPDIVFFGEPLPSKFHASIIKDFQDCDALIVMGTSLQVQPFSGLINLVGATVPRLLVNRDQCGDMRHKSKGFDFVGDVQKYRRDALFLGTCDLGACILSDALGHPIAVTQSGIDHDGTQAIVDLLTDNWPPQQ
ncbi:hypothetical protein BASA60_003600 [Batrachochytrium salamandrivorans]|nr:hypothetical protein BASA60_003600 [Batrachochytrium salamandrivorans]